MWEHSFLLLLVTGCASVSSGNPSDESSDYPVSWPQPIGAEYDASECRPIDGIYHSGGESNSTISERFSNPIFERNFFDLSNIANASNVFKVSHDAKEKMLNFEIFGRDGKLQASGLHKQYSRCESGWFVIESHAKGGSGDSPVKSTYGRTSIGTADDGSLLIDSHAEGVWRKFLFSSETRVSDIWYKFERADGNFNLKPTTN